MVGGVTYFQWMWNTLRSIKMKLIIAIIKDADNDKVSRRLTDETIGLLILPQRAAFSAAAGVHS